MESSRGGFTPSVEDGSYSMVLSDPHVSEIVSRVKKDFDTKQAGGVIFEVAVTMVAGDTVRQKEDRTIMKVAPFILFNFYNWHS